MISIYMPITPVIRRGLERRLRAGATPLELADERDLDPTAVRAIADRMCEPYRWSDEQHAAHPRLDAAPHA